MTSNPVLSITQTIELVSLNAVSEYQVLSLLCVGIIFRFFFKNKEIG